MIDVSSRAPHRHGSARLGKADPVVGVVTEWGLHAPGFLLGRPPGILRHWHSESA